MTTVVCIVNSEMPLCNEQINTKKKHGNDRREWLTDVVVHVLFFFFFWFDLSLFSSDLTYGKDGFIFILPHVTIMSVSEVILC